MADTLAITDTSAVSLPASTTKVIKFSGSPTVVGSSLSMALDGNGDQTRFLMGGGGVVEFDLTYALTIGFAAAVVRVVSNTAGRVGTVLASATVLSGGNPNRIVASINTAVDSEVHVEIVTNTDPGSVGARSVSISPPVPSPARARYSSATAQAVAASTDVVVAFGIEDIWYPDVSRATQGAGHRFTFLHDSIWAITATTRFVSGGTAGERYSALVSDCLGSRQVLTAEGGYNGSAPETMNLAFTGYFPAGSYLEVTAWQTGGSSLNLEGNVIWKNINFQMVESPA